MYIHIYPPSIHRGAERRLPFALHPGELCVFAHGNQAGFNYLNVVILTYAKRSNFKRQLPVGVLLSSRFLFSFFLSFFFWMELLLKLALLVMYISLSLYIYTTNDSI